ncbi:hypothetical protein PG984_007193 [Apiospora sp. TS-2023a]
MSTMKRAAKGWYDQLDDEGIYRPINPQFDLTKWNDYLHYHMAPETIREIMDEGDEAPGQQDQSHQGRQDEDRVAIGVSSLLASPAHAGTVGCDGHGYRNRNGHGYGSPNYACLAIYRANVVTIIVLPLPGLITS